MRTDIPLVWSRDSFLPLVQRADAGQEELAAGEGEAEQSHLCSLIAARRPQGGGGGVTRGRLLIRVTSWCRHQCGFRIGVFMNRYTYIQRIFHE